MNGWVSIWLTTSPYYKQNANVRVKAGFKAGDILIEFDSKKIDNLCDFTEALRAHKPGDKVSVDSPARNRKNNPDVTLEIHK